MSAVMAICIGACVGALARWQLGLHYNSHGWLPWGTLYANLIGGYLIGVCVAVFQALPELDDQGVVLEFCMQEPQRWLSLALRRVQGEDYGLCADCGGTIAFDRLRLEPWALRCVACESALESRYGSRLSA